MAIERRLGWRFLSLGQLRGRILLDGAGRRLGAVEATLLRADGGVDLLVPEDSPRGRVLRLSLDDVEVDGAGNLWRRLHRRLYRVTVSPAPVTSLAKR
ncbi:MAG TPA: hypothetical protein VEK76_13240 [Candidatus Binatia bacterium]|nr:hypothetical protein [Candidatus Binatia bacterium]